MFLAWICGSPEEFEKKRKKERKNSTGGGFMISPSTVLTSKWMPTTGCGDTGGLATLAHSCETSEPLRSVQKFLGSATEARKGCRRDAVWSEDALRGWRRVTLLPAAPVARLLPSAPRRYGRFSASGGGVSPPPPPSSPSTPFFFRITSSVVCDPNAVILSRTPPAGTRLSSLQSIYCYCMGVLLLLFLLSLQNPSIQ